MGRLSFAVIAASALVACADGSPVAPADAGPTDAQVVDSGQQDGGSSEAGVADADADAGSGACPPAGAALSEGLSAAVDLVDDGPDGRCASSSSAPSSLFHFVAPAAGWYRVQTEGLTDTVLELRPGCSETPVACNDQYGGDDARIWFEADAGELFEVVLSAADEGGQTTVRVVAGEPVHPRIDALTYYRGPRGFAFDIESTDQDVAGARVLGEEGLRPLQPTDLGFELTGTSTLPDTVALSLVSHGGFEGPAVEVAAAAPATVTDACDPAGARSVCAPGSRCGFWDTPARCVEAGAPEIGLAELFVNAERRTVGVYVEGRDPQANLALVEVTLLDGEGQSLGPTVTTRLAVVEGDEQGQAGFASGPLAPALDPAQADVRVVDTGDERSSPLRVIRQAPRDGLEGDACDLGEALLRCPAGTVCSLETGAPGDPSLCAPPVLGCPEGVSVHVVTLTSTGTLTLDDEDFPTAGGVTTPAACGGGQPGLRVLELRVALDGFVRFEMLRASEFVDPLIWARTHCAEAAPALEIGCFDDPDGGLGLLPRGEVRVEPGAPLYLGLDRHSGPVDLSDLQLRIAFRGIDE